MTHLEGFLDFLERSPRAEVLAVGPKLGLEALRWLRRHDERGYSSSRRRASP